MSDRWEYKIVQPDKAGGITGASIRLRSEELLNQWGREGWECYFVKTGDFPSVFYLKRKL